MKKILFGAYLLLSILTSCTNSPHQANQTPPQTSPQSQKETPPKENWEKGKVIPQVPLRQHPNETFSLYLPANYSDSTTFPVIIFFDSHGDGSFPIKKYYELAETYDFILIGSNNSKNGVSMNQNKAVANHLIKEAKTRFSVNEGKIALCGFSGGAKVALLSGASNPAVVSIIYCGASLNVNPTHSFALLGFAGKKDMNYTSLVSFDWNMKNAPYKHYLIEWSGAHEWPTPDVFKDAFQFVNTGKIDDYADKQVTVTPEKVAEEENYKQQYLNAFQTKNLGWWRDEIAKLNAKKNTDIMYERLLGFISLACYSFSRNALEQNNLEVAQKILTIYKMADPDNEDCKKFTDELQRRRKGL